MLRFPQLNLDDGKALSDGIIVNETSDVLGRGIYLHDKNRLAQLAQERQCRVFFVQQHLVVKRGVDPGCDDFFDAREIHDHAKRIEPVGLEGNDRPPVMAMQMPALAVVVQQAMAVAKTNLARHTIHGLSEA